MGAKETLTTLREMQAYLWPQPTPGATAPDFCLAAARFLSGKILGFFPAAFHLNGFLDSTAARSISTMTRAELSSAWGKLSTLATLNSTVLPKALKWGGAKPPGFKAEFVHLWNHPGTADTLLLQGVPLVVGVSLHGTGTRDHFIVVVRDNGGTIWAIDSWGKTVSKAIVTLPNDFTFTMGEHVEMNAGSHTIIPCANPFFGYYRELPAKAILKSVLVH